jgi:hypothetical protein
LRSAVAPRAETAGSLENSTAKTCQAGFTRQPQAKAEASAELERAARSTNVGRTVERGPVVSALIERLERRADTGGGLDPVQAPRRVTCAHVSLQRFLRRSGTGAELVLREKLVTAHPAGGKYG